MWFAPFRLSARSAAADKTPERDIEGLPRPPWIRYPHLNSCDFFWRDAGQTWLVEVWEPFVHSLPPDRLSAYLAKYPPPEDWRQLYFARENQA
jgi:hypothetical protein